jgi:serine phosphatase RsbU (regulator of sigma subunit)
LWLPLIDGTERLGVLGVIVDEERAQQDHLLRHRLWRFATLVAETVATKTRYGDSVVQARRQAPMGLAAEIQWGTLPPLTFACHEIVVAGALEPAYEIAGDSMDYAVDPGAARFAVFDGMGHGLQSSQLSALAVATYRNGRRGGRSLTATAHAIDAAVESVFTGATFITAVLAELDTDSGVLTWINAGHPEPLLIRGGRMVKFLQVEPGLPFGLGLTPEPGPYPLAAERLQPGDQVLLYTDGIVEARSPRGEFFGVDRLIDLIARHEAAALSPAETMRRVVRALLDHQQGRLDDDASMLLVQYRGEQHGSLLPEGLTDPPDG